MNVSIELPINKSIFFMKKIIFSIVFTAALVALPLSAHAALTEDQIGSILNLIESFGADAAVVENVDNALRGLPTTVDGAVDDLQEQVDALTTENEALKEALKLKEELDRGDESEEVKKLQKFLSTDPDVYPEALVTGYFGTLTEAAVRRFQAKFDIARVGRVGPQTLSHINYILENGAGKSGNIPPGLLMKFKGKSVFETLPPGIQRRCAKGKGLPSGVPFGIFAACDIDLGNGTSTDDGMDNGTTTDDGSNEGDDTSTTTNSTY